MNPSELQDLREAVHRASRIVVLSGAGMSAESGVPTFRDAQSGHWARFRPEDLATEEGFRADPALVWDWYQSRRDTVAQVEPNAGHRAIAQFQRRHPGRLTVITQNVDGLHQRAGSTGVLALHGNLFEDRWLDGPHTCCDPARAVPGHPPRCGACGNLRRPAVVWFGEMLPQDDFEAAQRAAGACELMLVVGTSGVVQPAASLAQCAGPGAQVVVVNPEPSALDTAAHRCIRGTAATVLPLLLSDDPA